MKKLIPLAMIALSTVAVSCSSDDDNGRPAEPTKNAISFAQPFISNSVNERGAITKASLDQFKVWGFVDAPDTYIFEGRDVVKTGDNWVTAGPTEYWYLNHDYYFTGLAPDDSFVTFTPVSTASDTYLGGGQISFDNASAGGDEDLVYAFRHVNHKDQASVEAVPMTFSHMLSQIMFRFTNNVSPATSLQIRNLNLNGVAAKGTIDMTQGDKAAWTNSGTCMIADIDADQRFAHTESEESEASYIIPETGAYVLSFTVDVYNGNRLMDSYDHSVTLKSIDYLMGNSYRFTTVLNAENVKPNGLQPIEFTVEQVNDWNDAADTPVVLPE